MNHRFTRAAAALATSIGLATAALTGCANATTSPAHTSAPQTTAQQTTAPATSSAPTATADSTTSVQASHLVERIPATIRRAIDSPNRTWPTSKIPTTPGPVVLHRAGCNDRAGVLRVGTHLTAFAEGVRQPVAGYFYDRQLLVFDTVAAAQNATKTLTGMRYGCAHVHGVSVRTEEDTDYAPLSQSDLVAPKHDGTKFAASWLATAKGDHLGWVDIVSRENNAVAITRVVQMVPRHVAHGVNVTEDDNPLNSKVFNQHADAAARVTARYLNLFS